jgi:hypothetical protein
MTAKKKPRPDPKARTGRSTISESLIELVLAAGAAAIVFAVFLALTPDPVRHLPVLVRHADCIEVVAPQRQYRCRDGFTYDVDHGHWARNGPNTTMPGTPAG